MDANLRLYDEQVRKTLDLQKYNDNKLIDLEKSLQAKRQDLIAIQKETSAIKGDIQDQTTEVQALKSDIDIIASDNANLQKIISQAYEHNVQLSS